MARVSVQPSSHSGRECAARVECQLATDHTEHVRSVRRLRVRGLRVLPPNIHVHEHLGRPTCAGAPSTTAYSSRKDAAWLLATLAVAAGSDGGTRARL